MATLHDRSRNDQTPNHPRVLTHQENADLAAAEEQLRAATNSSSVDVRLTSDEFLP